LARYAVLLAAGRGERLWPLTSTRPKPLVPLPDGTTLLTRLLRQLRGLVDGYAVVVTPGPMGEAVRRRLEEEGFQALVAVQGEQLGTGHAALVGLRALPRGVDEVLIVNGDMFVDYGAFEALVGAGAPAVLGVRHREPWNYGILAVGEGGCLERVVEKPSSAEPGSLVNAGAYLVPRDVFEEVLAGLGPSPRGEIEITDAVTMLARRTCVRVVSGDWMWLDVGRPWDLFPAYRRVLEERLGGRREPVVEAGAEVEPGALLRGPVYVAPGAVVRAYTVVEGPAWVAGEAGPLARLRPGSFLLEDARAGAHTEVKNSVLMRGAKAPHLNYVGDSVLGEGVNLGAGTVTANLRFDHATVRMRLKGRLVDTGLRKLGAIMGDYSQTGVNVSTLPGTRVGAYSWIYPGTVLGGDVPDCTLARPAPGGGVELRSLEDRMECPPSLRRR
jgi:UDP-N-acetylglucosamine diphosphorylase/glucosamine-1-phosphate N-acetyltransferase